MMPLPTGRARTALLLFAGIVSVFAAPGATTASRKDVSSRVLFVGNSLIYTNNLPAMFAAIARATPGAAVDRVDMFARGGASLGDLERDPRLVGLIESGHYNAIVMQERGGDVLCMGTSAERSTPACRALVTTHVRLARRAHAHGARVIYLGTYQRMPEASQALVAAEALLARRMGARHIEISETLRATQAAHPALPWRHADGMHPGVAATALIAARIHHALHGALPPPFRPCLDAETFPPDWKHDGLLADTDRATARGVNCVLDPTQMAPLLEAAGASRSTVPHA